MQYELHELEAMAPTGNQPKRDILFTNIQNGKGIRIMPEKKDTLPEWITTTEAAEIMEVAVSNVRYLCANERIECKKFGRNWMVSRVAAETYQRSNRTAEWLKSDKDSD